MEYKLKIYTFLFGSLDYNDKVVLVIPAQVGWRNMWGWLSMSYNRRSANWESTVWPTFQCTVTEMQHILPSSLPINVEDKRNQYIVASIQHILWRLNDELQTTKTLLMAISHSNRQRTVTWEWLCDNLKWSQVFHVVNCETYEHMWNYCDFTSMDFAIITVD